MEKEKKTVFVDTNDINSDGSLRVSEYVINGKGLVAGEEVIAYQDDNFWEAEVIKSADGWGVSLKSTTQMISRERQEGHKEGFWEGFYVQSARIVQVLNDLNYSEEEIRELRSKLGIL
ncbi:MAG: hypothetical protein IJZ00_10905 [Lachnospiraceae bacterium]|nr:hypothetical protein [Lachnospiraceae bacterium]